MMAFAFRKFKIAKNKLNIFVKAVNQDSNLVIYIFIILPQPRMHWHCTVRVRAALGTHGVTVAAAGGTVLPWLNTVTSTVGVSDGVTVRPGRRRLGRTSSESVPVPVPVPVSVSVPRWDG